MKYILSLILLFNQVAWADDKCPESVQVIEKGEVANCSGVLLSPDASKKADEAIADSKYYKSLSEKLQLRVDYSIKESDILDKRLKLYVDQSQTLSEQLTKREHQNEWQKYLYFGLGVLATGIAVYGASEIQR
jgi:hypothetical protein